MHWIYNLLLKVTLVLGWPVLLPAALLSKRWRPGLGQRLGFMPRKLKDGLLELPQPRVWFHAASVGELSAVAPIAAALKARHPEAVLVLSTNTQTGLAQAKAKVPELSLAFLLPLDLPGAMRRLVQAVAPALVIITETELWPNLLAAIKRQQGQLALVNGRLSEKSLKGYSRIKGMVRAMLSGFDLITVQSESDGLRFRQLGANPQRLKVLGNVKADAETGPEVQSLAEELRLIGKRVWVAGSTRPGEEAIILEAFQQVRAAVPDAVLILAPRHLDRLKEVERLLAERRFTYTLRSHVAKELLDFPVILLDTMGELRWVYGLGHCALVGGSLMPFGGHNLLEPAAWGVPVLMGPHTEHFAETAHRLLEQGGAVVVNDAPALARAVTDLLNDPVQARRQGEQARRTVAAFQGAAGRTVDLLQKLMLIKNWARSVKSWRQDSLRSVQPTSAQSGPDDEWLP